ncbi:MAG: endonuclease/exonuclease/phosphatase family protein [Bacteroidales bacterium]|nr:endonuclease/exonuclease/phosphatase family protein [Bacteroidales bacterium]
MKGTTGYRKKRPLLLGLTSRAMMLVAALLLWLSYLSVFFNPARAWIMTIFGLLFIPILLLNLFLLVWAAVRRSGAILIPLIALLPSLFVLGRYVQLKAGEPQAEDGIKVVSYNVGRFAMGSGLAEQQCADSVAAFLRGSDADIICLQEFHHRDPKAVKSWLSRNFKGYGAEYFVYTDKSGCYGNVTLSRFPALDKGKVDFGKSSNLAIWTEYDAGGTRLRVYNCHFQSYNISLSRLVKSIAGDYRKTFRDTEEKMRTGITTRPRQVEAVIRHIEQSPVASLVCGDFNDNPLSYTYWRLCRGRKDSFTESGRGAGATFRPLWPLLRIDYVLYPEAFKRVSHSVQKKNFSDHYPVKAEFAL